MIKIVIGGQLDKKLISKIVEDIGGDNVKVEIKNDLDAVMAMKNKEFDYYLGACETGSGGALAMAIALLGSEKTHTVARPGHIESDEEIINSIKNGSVAFGFTGTSIENVVPILVHGILYFNKK